MAVTQGVSAACFAEALEQGGIVCLQEEDLDGKTGFAQLAEYLRKTRQLVGASASATGYSSADRTDLDTYGSWPAPVLVGETDL